MVVKLSRRRLLEIGAASAISSVLGPAARAQPEPASKLTDLDHIIVLMKENRSFDHYFGTFSGVRGFDDRQAIRLPDGRSVFRQPDPLNPDGEELPFHLDTSRTSAQRLHVLNHAWGPQHRCWNGGKMNGWIAAHRAADRESGPLTMGYLARTDIPFYYALADAFTICDGYHASMLGPTHPNRFFLMTGTIDPDGTRGGPAITNRSGNYNWESYPERLQRAGISWRVYHDVDDYNCNVVKYLGQFRNLPTSSPLSDAALRNRPFAELLSDLHSGNLPQVTWIVPPAHLSEHPDYLPAAGAHHTHLILQALWSNPALWARTAVILNYDENDGQFDHVVPPTPEPGTRQEFIDGEPIGLGFRVPCIVISPWSRGGYVCSEIFDHTSVLRLIEARFGVEVAHVSDWRRRTCGDLTAAFGFGETARLDRPELPDSREALRLAERQADELPPPQVPQAQSMPRQEPGNRPRRGKA
jgi:phospholipase C